MSFGRDPQALLGGYHVIQRDLRLRLRLARSSDRDAIQRLIDAHGNGGVEFQLGSLVHFDPRRRYVLCASALIDSTETVVGLGVIEFDGEDASTPSVVVDPRYPEVAELLSQALSARAREAARARAA
jgi:hypothetical protein